MYVGVLLEVVLYTSVTTIHNSHELQPIWHEQGSIASSDISSIQVCLSDYLLQSTKTTILHGSDNSATVRSAL